MERARRGLALALVGMLALAAGACGGGSSRAALPVMPCTTTDAASGRAASPEGLPADEPAPDGVNEAQASQLAWYEGDVNAQEGLRVLAPRGWRCSAVLGLSESWGLTVKPPGSNGTQVKISAVYGGPAAQFACDYFHSAVARAPLPRSCARPADTAITHVGDHLVFVETAIRGLPVQAMLFWFPELEDKAEGARCLLPKSRATLCRAIIAEARSRVGAQLTTDAQS